MSVAAIPSIDPPAIEQKAITIVERAKALQITNNEQRETACELGRNIAALDKEAELFFKPMKEKAWEAHKEICTKEKTVRDPLQEAKRYLSREIGTFDQRMEEERVAKEARLQDEVRQQAVADAAKESQEQAIADAIELEAAGDHEGAQAVLNNPAPIPVHVPAVVLQSSTPKAKGVSSVQTWDFEITDANLIPREYLIPDLTAIGGVVRALKDKASIPGVKVFPRNGARFRA